MLLEVARAALGARRLVRVCTQCSQVRRLGFGHLVEHAPFLLWLSINAPSSGVPLASLLWLASSGCNFLQPDSIGPPSSAASSASGVSLQHSELVFITAFPCCAPCHDALGTLMTNFDDKLQ